MIHDQIWGAQIHLYHRHGQYSVTAIHSSGEGARTAYFGVRSQAVRYYLSQMRRLLLFPENKEDSHAPHERCSPDR